MNASDNPKVVRKRWLIPLVLLGMATALVIVSVMRQNSSRRFEASSTGPSPSTAAIVPASGQNIASELSQAKHITNDSDLTVYLRIVDSQYGLVLSSFGLSDDKLMRLKKLLAERKAAFDDLSDLRGSRDPEIAQGARLATQSGKIDRSFRQEMQAFLNDAEWQNVSRMLDVEPTLFGLENEYAKALIASNNPLSGGQLFFVADKMDTVYGKGIGDPIQYASTIDSSSGFTKPDEAFLAAITERLTPTQVSQMRDQIRERNVRIMRVAVLNSKSKK